MAFQRSLLAATALMASFIASAGTVSTQCHDGKFTIDVGVFSGESCNVTQTVTINGVADTQTSTVTENSTNQVKLEASDQASVSVQMSCSSPSGSSSVSASASTDSGCL